LNATWSTLRGILVFFLRSMLDVRRSRSPVFLLVVIASAYVGVIMAVFRRYGL
jgi:hypothetical protein